MKIREIMENASVGATASGAVATVAAPIGGMQTRSGGSFFTGIQTTDPTPNTPKKYKTKKKSK